MNRFRISTPEGTRDLLFSSCRALRQTASTVGSGFLRMAHSSPRVNA